MTTATYRPCQFTAGDALKLVGQVADVTEEVNDETGETLTHTGAKVAAATSLIMTLIVHNETGPNVLGHTLHNVFLNSVRAIANVTQP